MLLKDSKLTICRASEEDFSGILKLQSRYYINNVPQNKRDQGFLSAEFTMDQLDDMARNPGIIVARVGHEVIGYLCSSRPDLVPMPDILVKMVEDFDKVIYNGMPIDSYQYFIYGPVCIEERWRGKKVLKMLYEGLLQAVEGKYNLGVFFISESNPHSVQAHEKGLAMKKVSKFRFNGMGYHTLAFDVTNRSSSL